jgi:WD40 repeat protein
LSRTARVWDWRKKKPVLELRESEEAFFEESGGPWLVASFSPDGRLILTASDPGFRVWNASTGQSLAFLPHANPGTTGGAFDKKGALVITANWDGVARVWDWRNDRVMAELKADDEPIGRAAFSPDGDHVVTTTVSPEPTMRVWDWRQRKVVATLSPAAGSSFSPDGKLLAALGLTVRIWDWENDRVIAELRGPGFPFAAEFSRNAKFVVTSTGDVTSGNGGIQVWDWAAEQLILKFASPFSGEVSFSPDARLITAGAMVYECDLCGSLESLLALTSKIVPRELSAVEQAKYVE